MFEEPETVAKWTGECYWVNGNHYIISGFLFSANELSHRERHFGYNGSTLHRSCLWQARPELV